MIRFLHSPLLPAVLVALLLFFAPPVAAETISGRVVQIADGDTLTLLDAANRRHKIRLAGIDAPELGQAFGQQARTTLSALAFERQGTARCRLSARGRSLLCVVVIAGRDIGLEQVRAGSAWRDEPEGEEQTAQERADYGQAEFNAKIRRLGLWNAKNPTPPRDWRQGRADH